LERALGSTMLARGALELLWESCYECGDDYVGTADDIEQLVRWQGEPGKLASALFDAGGPKGAGFIELDDSIEDSVPHYRVHDLFHHAPEYVTSRRSRERERQRPKMCERCGDCYHSADAGSKFCSPACRTGGWRDRQKLNAVRPSETSVKSNADAPTTDALPCDFDRDSNVTAVTPRDGPPAPAPAPAHAHAHAHAHGEEKSVCSETQERPEPPPSEPPRLVLIPELADERVLMSFPVDGRQGKRNGCGREWPLTQRQVDEWAECYRTLDIIDECHRALAWVRANPKNRKTYDGMPAFLNRWFAKSVNMRRGESPVISGSQKTAGNKAAIEAFLRRRGHVVE
jgi:hypothetical protein